MDFDLSFCELRCKEVVNVVDGKRLGHIVDLIFDANCGKIKGIVAPYYRKAFLFRPNQELFIPWKCVKKIGQDTILVELLPDNAWRFKEKHCDEYYYEDKKNRHDDKCDDDCGHDKKEHHHKCDHRCDKCMLFDCVMRWKHGGGEKGHIKVLTDGKSPSYGTTATNDCKPKNMRENRSQDYYDFYNGNDPYEK